MATTIAVIKRLFLVVPVLWLTPLTCHGPLLAQTAIEIGKSPNDSSLFQPEAATSYFLAPVGSDTQQSIRAVSSVIPHPGISTQAELPEVDAAELAEAWPAMEEIRRSGESQEREGRRLEGVFNDGFSLVTEDEEFELTFHVLNQVDYKGFFPTNQDPNAQSGFYLPRTRVYFEGKLTDPFRYEVSFQRSVEGVFDLLDANLDIRFSEGCQIRLGRTLIPYSYTWYDHLEQYFIAPERPLFPLNFGLSRAAGIQLWGRDESRIWDYSAGVYDGRLAGTADDSTIFDGVGYLNVRPFAVSRAGKPLENLNIGGSIVVGRTDEPTELLPYRTSIQSSENDEAANSASVVFLETNSHVKALGDRLIGAIHAAWYGGPCSLEAEWNAGQNDVINETNGETYTVPASGFHVTAASFLTGETVRRREEVVPLRPFDPRQGFSQCGAWEIYARYSYLNFGDILFDADLADRDEWTDELWMTDIGLNWYMNRHTKFYFNWQHANFASPVLTNEPAHLFSETNDLLWARCQVYF